MGKLSCFLRSFVIALTLVLTSLLSTPSAFANAKVDPGLKNFGTSSNEDQTLHVIAVMESPTVDDSNKPQRYQHTQVLEFLKARSRYSLKKVAASLKANSALNDSIRIAKLYWISNSFEAKVTPSGLRLLAHTPGITKIYGNRKITFARTIESKNVGDANSVPSKLESPGLKAIGLTKLIKEAPQLTGKGVVLGHLDTGIDATHPALAGKVILFYDAVAQKKTKPFDAERHGTHTAGVMVGGDRQSVFIGVAPEAKLISASGISDYDEMLRAMQFFLDPDGDSKTADIPRAVNNSWQCDGAPDMELFYKALSAWEAAGILPVFSAGNNGDGGDETITPPKEHPAVFAVGSFGKAGKLSSFSSHGPGVYKGQKTKRPDIVAPGEKILSTEPNDQYAEGKGTSEAAPHVTGSIGLLLQMEPNLNPNQIRQILISSATPVDKDGSKGTSGVWNNYYGYGRLNIYAAAKKLKALKDRLAMQSNGLFDLSAALFTSPESMETQDFYAPPAPLTAHDLSDDYGADQGDGDGWITL